MITRWIRSAARSNCTVAYLRRKGLFSTHGGPSFPIKESCIQEGVAKVAFGVLQATPFAPSCVTYAERFVTQRCQIQSDTACSFVPLREASDASSAATSDEINSHRGIRPPQISQLREVDASVPAAKTYPPCVDVDKTLENRKNRLACVDTERYAWDPIGASFKKEPLCEATVRRKMQSLANPVLLGFHRSLGRNCC